MRDGHDHLAFATVLPENVDAHTMSLLVSPLKTSTRWCQNYSQTISWRLWPPSSIGSPPGQLMRPYTEHPYQWPDKRHYSCRLAYQTSERPSESFSPRSSARAARLHPRPRRSHWLCQVLVNATALAALRTAAGAIQSPFRSSMDEWDVKRLTKCQDPSSPLVS